MYWDQIEGSKSLKHICKVKFYAQCILLTSCIIFTASAVAEGITKSQYELLDKKLETEYETAMNRCDMLKAHTNDICVVKARSKRSVGKAELKAKFDPTLENQVDMRIAIAEADYIVAVEICDANKDKALCINRAITTKNQAIADARTVSKTEFDH